MIHRLLLGILACLVAVPALPAQAEELRLEAVRDFKTYWRKTKDVSLRVEAVMTLKGNECVPAALELVRLLDDPEEKIRIAAMSVISTFKDVKTFQGLLDQLPDMKEQARRALLIEVISKAGIRELLPVIRQIALQDKRVDAPVKVRIAEAIGRLQDRAGSVEVLRRFLADSDATVRITAIDTIGKLRVQELGDLLVPALQDKVWQVQAAAIKAVGLVRVAKAIDPLIEIMRRAGRFQTDTADALFLITTKDFGVDPDQWTKTIATLRGFGWKMPTDDEVAKAKAARKRSDAYYGKKESKRSTFAKITTTSTRVLFIIDVSGSMEDHVVEKSKFDAGYDDYAKLTIVKSELMNTIDALDQNTRFNIVAFATDLKPWKKGLVPANVVSKSAARSFVKRLKPIGGKESAEMASVGLSSDLSQGRTNTFKALMYPFNIDPDKVQKTVFTGGTNRTVQKAMLDTVFFLSDGRPSAGKYVDTDEILKEVTRINKLYRIVFHTITIGQGTPKEFLRALAIQNGGQYVDLGS